MELTTGQYAKRYGVTDDAVIKACERGEIIFRLTRGGHRRIEESTVWKRHFPDGSDFDASFVAKHPPRASREDARELKQYVASHARNASEAANALDWMRRNERKLPQLRRDPAVDNAVRDHQLLG